MKINWRCPKCGERNKWKWESDTMHSGPITISCDHCEEQSEMVQDEVGNFAEFDPYLYLTVPGIKKWIEEHGFEQLFTDEN